MVVIVLILTSLFAVAFIDAFEEPANASTEVEYSSPSELHSTKTVVIHGRSVAIRPLFGRPVYMKPFRTAKALAFGSVQNQASPRGVYYEEHTPQYMNQISRRHQYPLPQCYTNKSGFMCCNKMLETEMQRTFNQLKASQYGTFKTCNTQKIANVLQQNLQRCFNSSFETIAAIDDFASMIHFYSDHVCKLEIDGR
uniref:Ground-like domain-containing protein n=1 Tax=Ascaris lumbricoides TaxID=6252 RepID=A0A9J2P1Q3_ASCLU